MRIDGNTRFIAHLGYPTQGFRAPLIYNPYFAAEGINAVVVPMACEADAFPEVLAAVFKLHNAAGALVTMPHKVSVVSLLDEVSEAVRICGACNAVKRLPDGRLAGDQFDGEGFVRAVRRKGLALEGARCLVVGCGGVGRAIAASLARAGVTELALHDSSASAAEDLGTRLRVYDPRLVVRMAGADPAGYDVVVNATPLGSHPGDGLPFDVARLQPRTFVGDVVLRAGTPLVLAARGKGCDVQPGADMLFEMIPAYLEFFGLPVTTPERLRGLAQLED